MKKLFAVVLGAILVACGVLAVLSAMGIGDISVSFDGWWTLFIIVPGVYGIITSKEKILDLAFTALGVYLLLAARGIIEYKMLWELLAPTVVILLGLKLIVKAFKKDTKIPLENNQNTYNQNNVKYKDEGVAFFSGKNFDGFGKEIGNTKIGAVFGGVKCSLIGGHFTDNSCLNVMCIFGGADIIVPEDVDVVINTFCLFGGVSDKRNINNNVVKNGRLTVNGFCMFGGADIK